MKNVVNNILVIGFHHKRGCEIEFMYPSLSFSSLPESWKNLSSLALPDGAHKTDSDVFYFILPNDANADSKVLYGVSCFKQISSDNVRNKTDEITRNTVQKSVVVLSNEPYFGAIGSLLHGITENYFDLGDFDQRDILIESYHQLNEHFRLILEDKRGNSESNTEFINESGVSVSDLFVRYEHNVFTLIKLIMLKKRLLCFMEPISKLTSTIFCLVSLFEGELTGPKFQNTMLFLDENSADNSSENLNIPEPDDNKPPPSDEIDCTVNDSEKTTTMENRSSAGTSLLQNIKSGGGQAIKAFSSFTTSGLMRPAESDLNLKQVQIDDPSAPLPSFIDRGCHVRDDGNLNCDNLRDGWGFPIGIFDEKNILLPYASLGYLNVLDNKKIDSFVIGASNHLWKMKHSKLDVIIHEDNKSGGVEFCKRTDETLIKLTQLTVLDRRLGDYMLGVIKAQNPPIIKSSSSSSISRAAYTKANDSTEDLTTIEIGEDILTKKFQGTEFSHSFPDQKSMDEWLRQVLVDYIRALLLSAAGLGNRQSFSEFGWDFMLSMQQLDYFEDWYHSIDKDTIVQESTYSPGSMIKSESTPYLTIPISPSRDNISSDNQKNIPKIMNYDHPGRFVPGKFGDNLPGYYQIKEYAGQSKALMNRSVNEIKRIGTEKGSQLKSSVSAGFSKLTGMAKIHGSKFGSSWWSTETKTPAANQNDNETVTE